MRLTDGFNKAITYLLTYLLSFPLLAQDEFNVIIRTTTDEFIPRTVLIPGIFWKEFPPAESVNFPPQKI